jgi:hypothetical protein
VVRRRGGVRPARGRRRRGRGRRKPRVRVLYYTRGTGPRPSGGSRAHPKKRDGAEKPETARRPGRASAASPPSAATSKACPASATGAATRRWCRTSRSGCPASRCGPRWRAPTCTGATPHARSSTAARRGRTTPYCSTCSA